MQGLLFRRRYVYGQGTEHNRIYVSNCFYPRQFLLQQGRSGGVTKPIALPRGRRMESALRDGAQEEGSGHKRR